MKSTFLQGALLLLLFTRAAHAAEQPAVAGFQEVYDVLKANLPDITQEELSNAAARGLIKELSPRVQLLTNDTLTASAAGVIRKEMFERFGYIRLGDISQNLDKEFNEAWKSLAGTNKLQGLILDLRYAAGQSYDAAVKTADHFVEGNAELARMGDRSLKAGINQEEIKLPVAILVNEQTMAAAEVLGAILRQQQAGIIIGSHTAGQARVFETVKLSTGAQLLVGKAPVEINGIGPISDDGLIPDINVDVEPVNARAWYDDPFKDISRVFAGSTNQAGASTNRFRRTFNEAELVRRHRDGTVSPEGISGDDNMPATINDPVLVRAVDFLKGVTTLKQLRPL